VCAKPNKDAVKYHAGLNWQMPDLNSFYYCRHRSMIKVIHKPNPSLTVRLSEVFSLVTVYTAVIIIVVNFVEDVVIEADCLDKIICVKCMDTVL